MGELLPAKQKSGLADYMAVLRDKNQNVQKRSDAVAGIVDHYASDLKDLLPPGHDFSRMKQLFILSCKQIPALLDCDPASLIKSLFTACSMGLEPDPYFGQVYLIPFGKNVQVIPGYKGLLQLVRNTGEIESIIVEAVYPNDIFDYDLASGQRPTHKPPRTGRGEQAEAYYCIANFKSGGFHFEYMSREDVDRVRLTSNAVKSGRKTPWNDHYDEMAKKTVLRRAFKKLPMSLSKPGSDRYLETALKADDAAHDGKLLEAKGDSIDVFSMPVADDEPNTAKASRLEKFESDGYDETHTLNPDTGELEPIEGGKKAE